MQKRPELSRQNHHQKAQTRCGEDDGPSLEILTCRAGVTARFTEVESGHKADRPELARALDLAGLTGATLVIAKLGRLPRNAAFLLIPRDSGVRYLTCERPEANDLTVGIMALVAQQECEAISRRTTKALAAGKARGMKGG